MLWPVKAIFEKRAVMVEVDTSISPALPVWRVGAQHPEKPGLRDKFPLKYQRIPRNYDQCWC